MTVGILALILMAPAVLFILTVCIWLPYIGDYYDSPLFETSLFLLFVIVVAGILTGLGFGIVWLVEHQNVLLW